MTIDLSTSLLGPVDTTPALLIPAFSGHAYDDATVAAFAAALVKWAGVFGIRASILAGQIGKETGFFKFGGDVPADAFNLGGLGATGGGVAGLRYPDISTGCAAVFTHWMVYIHGEVQNWPPDVQRYVSLDQRYAAVLSTGHAGKIAALADVTNGVWAYTRTIPIGSLANGYAAGIASLANQFVGAPPVSTVPTAADLGYPGHVHYATGSGEAMDIAAVQWFIVHDTEGHFAGDEATLSGQISAHLLIDKTGEWRFMVPLDTVAYAAGNLPVNRQSINVEHSGFVDGHDGGYTDAQYRCAAAFFRFCVANGMGLVPAVYVGRQDADGGPEPDVPGILGHMDVPRDDGQPGWGGNYGHTDPGPRYDFATLIGYIGNAPQPPAPPAKQFVIDGHDVGEGIYQLVNEISTDTAARIRLMGLCTSDQYDGYLVYPATDAQRAKNLTEVVHPVVIVDFERVPVIWDRGRTAAPFDVRIPMQHEYIGVADDPVIQAIIHSMQLVNEPV